MRDEIVRKLNALNQEFYTALAAPFAESRGPSEPGLARILHSARAGERVLDLGCGSGRIAGLLPAGCEYVGVDFSPTLLGIAEAAANRAAVSARWIVADLLDPEWPAQTGDGYDWVILRAVLHHIPGAVHRQQLLNQAAGRLAPAGQLLLANWQFLEVERLRRRIHPWSEVGIAEADLEPGDYLLDWRREGQGWRYVHVVDEAETRVLAANAGLQIMELFRADGREGNLTLYALLKPR